jgi:ATP-dependent Clp protease ATP-binding subunit ClpA
MLHTESEIAVNFALMFAAEEQHEYVQMEHLVLGLLHNASVQKLLRRLKASPTGLKERFREALRAVPVQKRQPSITHAVRRVVTRAQRHAETSEGRPAHPLDLLVAVFAESDSPAVHLLEQGGVSRLAVVEELSRDPGLFHLDDDAARPPVDAGSPEAEYDVDGEGAGRPGPGGGNDGEDPEDVLAQFCTNLNERAQKGMIDQLVGRQEEVYRAINILARRRKNNPIFVGESGVGKTAIVEGMALRIVQGEVPPALQDAVIYSLDMAGLLAGTRYRGDFEARLKAVLKALADRPGSVLFIDEIHTAVGAGRTEGGENDASNMLKPALADGTLRCIGSTTYDEYRRRIQSDRALARRFQKIDVDEPSEAEAILILQGLQPRYEEFHGVTYAPGTIEEAVRLSARHFTDRKLPDKAVDLLDEAGATVKIDPTSDRVVRLPLIRDIVARAAKIPSTEVKVDDRARLSHLEQDLRGAVYGQDDAVREVVAAVKLARSGLANPDRPLGVFVFTGPTGVGKTEIARQLAKTMSIELIRFDMSEYMERHAVSRLIGAPPGYVGFEQGGLLTEAINRNPHAVLLLDEIEKAHPEIFNILLQVMDAGRLTDNNGRTADFRNVILIMTSNVGARELSSIQIGFSAQTRSGDDERAYTQTFSPEFRNRIDARVRFRPLAPEVMDRIVHKFIAELESQLSARKVTIALQPAAAKLLADKGFDPSMGARPLGRVIRQLIKAPLSDALLFGDLVHGGHVLIDAADGELTFAFEGLPAPPEDDDTAAPPTTH